MRRLTNELYTAYKKMGLPESPVYMQSIQKVLKLFGYANSQDTRYICCLGTSPRIDIHKYKLGTRNFVMCIVITDKYNVLQAALWDVTNDDWNIINRNTFMSCTDIPSIDTAINELTLGRYKLIMKY